MYTLIRENLPRASGGSRRGATALRSVSGTVILLGLTSLVTDISSEMVTTVLPLYFIVYLQLTPLSFGLIEGFYQAFGACFRLLGGVIGDKFQRHKDVAVAGYGLSSICKLALIAVGGAWMAITGVLVLDRLGKAIRTGPRDAMISLNSDGASLGAAFGVHRALDSLGALLGPVLAFVILSAAPGAFDSIFMVSFCVSLVGLGILVLFVSGRTNSVPQAASDRVSFRSSWSLLSRPYFRRLTIVSAGLSLFTISDGFLYLVVQKQVDLDFSFFPILYLGTATAYFALAIPAGMLADHIGRARVMIGGYLLLLAVYSCLLREPEGAFQVTAYLVLFGAYYAATDGVLMALASRDVPEETRGSGLALIGSITGLARFAGSALFGAVWTFWSADAAILLLLAGLTVTIACAIPLLGRDSPQGTSPA
ncbi:hypothetical protein AYO38_03470 [bacterium SCGC AG-212-C10]|nr:hypothetical protein AYO38_03470 [bacterium SCGC AG-212-C10]